MLGRRGWGGKAGTGSERPTTRVAPPKEQTTRGKPSQRRSDHLQECCWWALLCATISQFMIRIPSQELFSSFRGIVSVSLWKQSMGKGSLIILAFGARRLAGDKLFIDTADVGFCLQT